MITQQRVCELFDYDQSSGALLWRTPRGGKSGVAGWANEKGYVYVGVDRKLYLAHQIIWLMHYGELPDEIDHIDHDPTNNRLANLRAVGHAGNMKNMSARKSGGKVYGVHWYKQTAKWAAYINSDGIRHHLGYFCDWFEAVCARKSAEANHGFHPNHGC